MKPIPFAVASALLLLSTCINVFGVSGLFGGQDFLDFLGVLVLGVFLAGGIAFCALLVVNYAGVRKPFSVHPILSGLGFLNMAYPIGRLFFL